MIIIKAYAFFPPDGRSQELPINMTDGNLALAALNTLVKNGELQGFLFLMNQKESE